MHVGVEQLVAVLAPGLGRVHGHVGVAEQLLGLVGAGPPGGHAQAGLDRDGAAVEAERLVQGVEHPAGDRRRRLGVGDPLQQHRELVAAQAGRGVGRAQAALEPPGGRDQQLVAGGVAEAVVDVLEVVQVDEQDGQVALARAGQGVLDPLGEQGAVGQAGQPVVEGLVDELGLQLLAVRDVAGVEHQAADVGVFEQVGGDRLGVQPGAVAVAHAPGLGGRHPRPQGRLGHEPGHPLAVVGVDQAERVAVDQVGRVVAEHPPDRLAVVADGAVGVDDADHVGGVLDQRPEPLLAGPHRPLGRLALLDLGGERRIGAGEVLADPLAQRQGQGQADDQHHPAQPDQQSLGVGPGVQGPAEDTEEPLLLGVVELLDADVHAAEDRPHPLGLGPQAGLGRVRLGPGQGAVDQAQVPAGGHDHGVDRRVAAAEALELVQLVAEQGTTHLDLAQVADGRQRFDLGVEQQRLALDVDQVAGDERLLTEGARGAVDVDVGLQDQQLDDHDEHHQHAPEGELQRAAPPAQDAGGVDGPRLRPARAEAAELAGHGPRRPSSRRRSRSTGPGCGRGWSCRGTRSGSARTGRPACACRRPWWPAASGSCARRPP